MEKIVVHKCGIQFTIYYEKKGDKIEVMEVYDQIGNDCTFVIDCFNLYEKLENMVAENLKIMSKI